MKRYRLWDRYSNGEHETVLKEDPSGELVKWEDVAPLIDPEHKHYAPYLAREESAILTLNRQLAALKANRKTV